MNSYDPLGTGRNAGLPVTKRFRIGSLFSFGGALGGALGGGVWLREAHPRFLSASLIVGLDVISAFFQQRWEVGRLPSETGAGSQLAVGSQ